MNEVTDMLELFVKLCSLDDSKLWDTMLPRDGWFAVRWCTVVQCI